MDSRSEHSRYIESMQTSETFRMRQCSRGQEGFTNFEMLLVFLIVVFTVGTLIPAFLASRHRAAEQEIGIRLAVIQQAKRDVMKKMNLILPRESRIRITDRVNPLHVDEITRLTLESPWRFQPDDPDPLGGELNIGETFLEPPSSSLGIPIADLDELLAKLTTEEETP